MKQIVWEFRTIFGHENSALSFGEEIINNKYENEDP